MSKSCLSTSKHYSAKRIPFWNWWQTAGYQASLERCSPQEMSLHINYSTSTPPAGSSTSSHHFEYVFLRWWPINFPLKESKTRSLLLVAPILLLLNQSVFCAHHCPDVTDQLSVSSKKNAKALTNTCTLIFKKQIHLILLTLIKHTTLLTHSLSHCGA